MPRILRNGLALLWHARQWPACLRGMVDQTVLDTRGHMELTADALLRASRHSRDGGYAIGFSLLHGWQRGYVETTGYIVPTALDLAAALGRDDLRADALRQGAWLLDHQRDDGSFPDITRQESAAFDTGQVLLGLTRLYLETGDSRYERGARRAADWLCNLAQPDGSWRGSGDTQDRSPTYLTRSAAALLAFGRRIGEARYIDEGRRFLDWSLTRQMESGLFRDSELRPGEPYLLHTLVYVLEGLMDAYAETGEPSYLAAVRRGADPLVAISLQRDITLYSHYAADLRPASDYACITGLAQWAALGLRLYEDTGEEDFLKSASNALFYLKSKQLRVDGMLRGALPGSVPIWGDYLKLSYPGWNLKFFADALLLWRRLAERRVSHQETYVATSHRISAARVGWAQVRGDLADFDRRVLRRMETTLRAQGQPGASTIVDLGCGEGRYVAWFAANRPDLQVIGVDPLAPEKPAAPVRRGSAHEIPLPDESVDAVYAAIALQHVADLPGALAEVRRVLRPGGVFIVFDRNPISLRGVMKPWHEWRGRWLYRWDSPFRERWYSLGAWCRVLRRSGYRVVERSEPTERAGAGVRRLLPINRFVYVAARKLAP